MNQVFEFFLEAYRETPTLFIWLEAIAFIFGIASVWYAKKRKYPGLSNRLGSDHHHGLPAFSSKIFWRYDDEFLLFYHEYLRLVELGS